MKKIILSFIIILFMPIANAEELTELNNYEIKYKFYKEKVDSLYYPKGLSLEGYTEDGSNIQYEDYTDWQDNCNINNNSQIEYKKEYTYKEIKKVGSIKLFNFSDERDQTGIIVYNGNKKINYQNVSPSWSEIHLKLDDYYEADNLLIYTFFLNKIDFTIIMYSDHNFEEPILEKRIIRSNFYNIVVDSKFYVYPNAYIKNTYDRELEDNFFRKKINENTQCRSRNILTYRYKVDREYYDNNYYEYIEGYQKDYDDFKIYYQKDTNYIEVSKIEKEYINIPEYKYFEIPKYEYVEIEKEKYIPLEPIPIIKKEYVNQNIKANNNYNKEYIFIVIILILSILIYKIFKKCRVN